MTGGAGAEPFTRAAANLPAEVFQPLSDLYPEGVPEDILSIFQAPYEGASRSKPYFATSDRAVSQSRGMAQLLAAVDRGSMSVEQFNAVLAAAAIDETTFKRALLELQRDPDLDAVRLCDTVYRLFGGRLVEAHPHELPQSHRLWAETVAVALLLLLLAAAIIRFS